MAQVKSGIAKKPAGEGAERDQNYTVSDGCYAREDGSNAKRDDNQSDKPAESKIQSRYNSYNEIKDKSIVETTPQDFHVALSEAKESVRTEDRWRVDVHGAEDYEGDKLFATPKGSCVAVEPDGNIISLCKNNADKDIHGADLLKHAVENGGDRLDAFSKLYPFYAGKGFEPVSWVPFDEQYAPEGWLPEYEKEPIIFWKYTGKKTKFSKDEFLKEIPASKSYDEAKEIRDRSIKSKDEK